VGVVRPIRREYRFAGPDGWTVRVVSVMMPGDTQFRSFYMVRQLGYLVRQTADAATVRRVMGDAAYAGLTEIPPSGWPSPSPEVKR
jgi:hypothetical protein